MQNLQQELKEIKQQPRADLDYDKVSRELKLARDRAEVELATSLSVASAAKMELAALKKQIAANEGLTVSELDKKEAAAGVYQQEHGGDSSDQHVALLEDQLEEKRVSRLEQLVG